MADDVPWFAPGHHETMGKGCRLWTLVKGARRVDAELLFNGECGV